MAQLFGSTSLLCSLEVIALEILHTEVVSCWLRLLTVYLLDDVFLGVEFSMDTGLGARSKSQKDAEQI